jgi:hypothetical protein
VSVYSRWHYLRRVFGAYLGSRSSQLSFWHEIPTINPRATFDRLGEYYMTFYEKGGYGGPTDNGGIPLLDYHGNIGIQYNPIAIAQFGLGNLNLWARDKSEIRRERALLIADWLVDNLEANYRGLSMWMHKFDWEYRDTLHAPWYSGLAQGQGISLLLRAHAETENPRYLEATEKAFIALATPVQDGGTIFTDKRGHRWIEEYIVDPPTHILNGFLWALWGVHDYLLVTDSSDARELRDAFTETLLANLHAYDLGYWSLYEQSGTRLKMIASPFYHQLHIVQLRITASMTGERAFSDYADRWQRYRESRVNRGRALVHKIAFKAFYY